jgi:UDP-N-acetylmuramate dehydrogenase
MPAYPVAGGKVKLAAAWLIESAGFERGDRLGNAGISTRHSLALVNLGGATAAEIVELAARIRGRVRDRFGVTLTPEPTFLGFGPGRCGEEILDLGQ